MLKKASVAILIVPLVLAAALPCAKRASANSAPAYWQGADGMGVVAEGNCPVEVESEVLTLEIPTLPKSSFTAEEFAAYGARVTAEYTFYNPTAEPLTVELAFPFGTLPEYLVDGAAEERTFLDDSARYSVTVDGAAAGTRLRHTYYRQGDLSLPAGEKGTYGVLSESAVCRTYSYTAGSEDCVIEVRLSLNPARTRILYEVCRDYAVENGDLVLYLPSKGSFFAVGEAPQVKSVKAVDGEDLYLDERTYLADVAVAADEAETTFGAWAEESRPARVDGTDWFNAVLAYAKQVESPARGLIHGAPSSLREEDLMRWFTYTLQIPAGETVQNRVTAPLYPDITGASSYYFCYLLSPAQGWADFGTFTLNILTGYEVEGCTLALEKTEGGYTFGREGLPLGELTFRIGGGDASPSAWGTFAVSLPLVLLGAELVAGIVLAVVFGVRAHRRKKRG